MSINRELAEAVIRLLNRGIDDPHATEIANEHFRGAALTPYIIDYVRDNLTDGTYSVRSRLGPLGYEFCPVTQVFYDEFRSGPPTEYADVRRCVPGGPGKKTAGLLYPQEGDPRSVIFTEYKRRHGLSVNGSAVRLDDSLGNASADGQINLLQEGVARGGYAEFTRRELKRGVPELYKEIGDLERRVKELEGGESWAA